MDAKHFAVLTHSLATASPRRVALIGALGTALSAALSRFAVEEAAAKRKKKGKKKKKKGNGRNQASPPVVEPTSPPPPPPPPPPEAPPPPPPPLPPPPPPPPPPAQVTCDIAGSIATTASQRFAQTFLPPRTGLLTNAQVFLDSNPANFDLTFEIRPVDGAGKPTADVLATRTVRVTATDAADPPKPVPATFAAPAAITAGQLHALVVTAPTGENCNIMVHLGGNVCPDGKLFQDTTATNTFVEASLGTADMVFTVTIV
jgi:hypothetical protein